MEHGGSARGRGVISSGVGALVKAPSSLSDASCMGTCRRLEYCNL